MLESALAALVREVVPDLAGAKDEARDPVRVRTPTSSITTSKPFPGARASRSLTASRCRSRLFGLMTTSGLRYGRTIWRLRRWKIRAGVVKTQTWSTSHYK